MGHDARGAPGATTSVEGAPAPWSAVFAQSSVPTAVLRGETYVWANAPFARAVGLPVEDIPGLPYTAFSAGMDETEIRQSFQAVAAGSRRTRLHGFFGAESDPAWARLEVTVIGPGAPERDPADVIVLLQAIDLTDLHRARTALSASERRMRELLGNIEDTVTVTDPQGQIVFNSGAESGSLGYAPEEWKHIHPLDLVHPDEMGFAVALWDEVLRRPGEELSGQFRLRTADGEWADVITTAVNLLEDPDVAGLVVTSRNVTALRRAERLTEDQKAVLELMARGEPLHEVLEACRRLMEDHTDADGGSTWIMLMEEGRHEVRAGETDEELMEWWRDASRPPTLVEEKTELRQSVVVRDVYESPLDPEVMRVVEALGARAGWSQPIIGPADEGAVGAVTTLYDRPHTPTERERAIGELAASLVSIALVRTANEQRLAEQALHDDLTGLPNRVLLADRLDHALARRSRTGGGVAVLFCDLDRFKVFNDSLGHGHGDELLVAFARRLASVVEAGDTVARFGGDEFVILLEDLTDEHHAVVVAERVAASLQEPFHLASGQEVHLTASIGVTTSTEHQNADAWLRDADAAMYEAKGRGRNRFELFDTAMRDAAIARLEVQTELRHAIRQGELVMHYQPVIDLSTGCISGAEALVRWQHPRRGLVPPLEFVPIAEEIGLIHELGAYVLDLSLREMAAIRHRLRQPFVLGVNVSARQLTNPALTEEIEEICARHDWPRSDVLLEITESTLAAGPENSLALLAGIHRLGVDLAIDDFGTGHSSLDRLGRMPVDMVKIDRSFVSAIDDADPRMTRIVDAVIGIAAGLRLTTCAEGVETRSQLRYLRDAGCGFAQGYLFSRPLPPRDFEAFVEAGHRW